LLDAEVFVSRAASSPRSAAARIAVFVMRTDTHRDERVKAPSKNVIHDMSTPLTETAGTGAGATIGTQDTRL
jgi:hypothetical protein